LKYFLFLDFLFNYVLFSFSNNNLPSNHIRHAIFYEYSRGASAAQAAKKINNVYGEGSTSQITCQTYFARFCNGATNFRDLQPELDEQHFEKDEDVKKWLKNYFDTKPRVFFEGGIQSLSTKWAQVIYNNGEYFE
jgi:hypothetical protein